MRDCRSKAKQLLKKSTKTKFYAIVEEGNVADEDRDIAFLKIAKKRSYASLSIEFHCSVEHIRDVMAEVYDKVYEVIKGGLI